MAGRPRTTVVVVALVSVVASIVVPIAAADTLSVEFTDAPVADILVAIGKAAGLSVVPDDTVVGSASYYLRDVDAVDALAELAERYNLFVTLQDGVHSVSGVRIVADGSGRFSVDAAAVEPARLLARLSRIARTPILTERLPTEPFAYYCDRLELPQMLAQIALRLPEHDLLSEAGAWVFSHRRVGEAAAPRADRVTRGPKGFSIASESAPLPDLLRELFQAGEREYQLLLRGEPVVGPLDFADKPFDELLRLVLEPGGAGYSRMGDVYYVTEAAPGAATARTLVTESLVLDRLPVASLLDLLPPERLPGVTVRPDRSSGTISLTGSATDVARVRDLVRALDSAPPEATLHRIELTSITPAQLAAHLPPRLRSVQIVPLARSTGITAYGSADELAELERVVALVDRPEPVHLVTLSHLTVDELRTSLPAGVAGPQIVSTGDPHRFFFTGTDAAHERLLRDLSRIDRAVPQLVYHLLVIQHQEGEGLEFDANLGNALTSPDTVQAFVGSIGNLLSLDFDIVSSFGYRFAAQLDASVTESRAVIVADATLAGLSGEPVSFRNTSTYRYRDVDVDPETGEPHATGVVREIASGLVLEIVGSVRGELVTIDVATTISRRGTDTSGSGNPPPTSEKVVRTRIRTRAGHPAIVGGLRLREDETSVRRTPLLGRIPLLGMLFQGRRDHADLTEVAVYIVPHIVESNDGEADLVDLYEHHYGATP